MATKQAIPLDIIETIIDCLAGVDDQKHTSVKACSLACRSFVHFCRKHIFASVALDCRSWKVLPRSPTSTQFRKLLCTSPDIINYVRKLKLAIFAAGENGEMNHLEELSGLFKRFTRIQDLVLQPRNEETAIQCHEISWSDLPHHLQDSLLHLLDLPSIERVQLSGIEYFPILELARCANFRSFHLEEHGQPTQNLTSTLPSRSIMLHELCMVGGPFVADLVTTPAWPNGQPLFDLGNLKRYSVPWYWHENVNVARQILKRTDKLVSIDLRTANRPPLFDVLGLSEMVSHLQLLRRIGLRHVIKKRSWNVGNVLAGLPYELKKMRQNQHPLEQIEIYVYLAYFLHNDFFIQDEWSVLDDALNDPNKWSSLKTVSIEIKTRWRTPDTALTSALNALVQKLLPILSSNRDITLDFKVVNQFG